MNGSSSKINIFNARIVSHSNNLLGSVIIEADKILEISAANTAIDGITNINAHGNWLAPGFIDLHVHGGGGFDTMDGTPEALSGLSEWHASHGTTSLLSTTMAAPNAELGRVFGALKTAGSQKGANILGFHLEGPYYSHIQKGAQSEECLVKAERKHYEEILSLTDDIKIWSAAPEIEGVLEFGKHISNNGIIAAIGHSDATIDDVKQAIECGFSHVTHLYSTMSSIRRIGAYRVAGLLEAAFLFDELTCELIADGSHVPVDLIKLALKVKPQGSIALVTDALRFAGMPDGVYTAAKIIVEDNVAKLQDRSAFAGSVAGTDMLVRNMVINVGLSVAESVDMMTQVPSKILKIHDKKGDIKAGMDADLIVFDEKINITLAMVGGRIVSKIEEDRR